MHRSRLTAVLVDCEADVLDEGVRFWSAALGRESRPQKDGKYVNLDGEFGEMGGIQVLLQGAAREHLGMHLDIETDDVAAEVARLEGLGAITKKEVKNWTVMESPSGHAFCVVPVHRKDFPSGTTEWE